MEGKALELHEWTMGHDVRKKGLLMEHIRHHVPCFNQLELNIVAHIKA